MKFLFVKMRRDIKSMWVQFFSVFMMSLLAITIYSGMEGVWFGLQTEVNTYYEDTNLSDIWVNGKEITDDMVDKIANIDGVNNVEKSMTLTVSMKSDNEDKPDLKLLAMDSLDLFNPIIRDGDEFDSESEDGVWLDESIANKRNIKLGDSISLKYGKAQKDFEVKGLILDSEFIYYTGSVTDTVPNHEVHGYGLISNKAAKSFYRNTICNELRISTDKDCNVTELQNDVEDILGDSYYSFSQRDDISSVSQITKEINQMKNMANLFSAVFIFLALLSMYTTMTRLVNTQMVQIGTMKAVGFTNADIRIHYMCYGLFVSLTGCLIGTVLGRTVVSKAVMKVKKATLTIPLWQIKLSYRTYLIILGIVFVCIIATVFAVRKGLNKLPAETMRASAAGSEDKKQLLSIEHSKFMNNFEYSTKWMIRDILQNRVRWIMSIIGIAGSMVLLMAGLGFKDSINYSNDYVYKHQYSYKYKTVLQPNSTDADLDEVMSKINGDSQEVYEYNMEMYYDNSDDKEQRTISVIGDGDLVNLETLDGKSIELTDDTVVISKKIAQKLKCSVGDTIKCRVIGSKDFIDFKVTDIAIAPSPQGIIVSRGFWENNLGEKFAPKSILINSEEDYDAIKDLDVVKETATIDEQLESMKIMTKSVMTIVYLLILASVLLGCIIIYNLGMLNFIERYREYATMKVLGFYQKEIRNIIMRDCIITTVIGWVIGVPVGYKFLSFYIGIVQFKSFEWVPTLNNISFVISTIVVCLCSLIVNLIVAHKVTKISMIEALKSVE